MKEAREKAALCIVACAFFMTVALLLARHDIRYPAVFGTLVGLVCAWDCYFLGKEHEAARQEAKRQQDGDWMEIATGVKQVVCRNCKCERFQIVAGRLICLCCGQVAEVGDGEAGL